MGKNAKLEEREGNEQLISFSVCDLAHYQTTSAVSSANHPAFLAFTSKQQQVELVWDNSSGLEATVYIFC